MCLAADEVEQVAQLFFCGSEIDPGLFAQFTLDRYSLEMIKLNLVLNYGCLPIFLDLPPVSGRSERA